MENTLFRSTALFEAMKRERSFRHEEEPLWLREARRGDAERLSGLVWPTVKNDEWKYTNLSLLAKKYFKPVRHLHEGVPARYKDFFIPGGINLVFVNGLFSEALSFLDHPVPGLVALNAGEALDSIELLKGRIFELTRNDSDIFLSLNRVLFRDILYLEVEKGVKIKEPVHIIHLFDGEIERPGIFARTFLKVSENAGITLLETHVALKEGEYFSNPVTEVLLEAGASCEFVQAHQHAADGFHVGSTRIWQAKDSRCRSFVYTSGARIFRNNLNVLLQGEGAEAAVNGLHALKGDRHADSHTFVEHIAPNARSNQLYKCVVDEKAHSVFNGKILVRREAQLTNSYQLNKNLLLSSECKVDTKPQLEIFADDVKCSHGATIGQLSEDELFYLETRGLNREDASRMLIRGFIDDVVGQVVHPDVRARVAAFLK
mgnify:CR=1 FL=1